MKLAIPFVVAFLIASCGAKDEKDAAVDGPRQPDQPDALPQVEASYRTRGNDKGNGGDVVICFRSEADATAVSQQAAATQINPFSRSETWQQVDSVSMLDLVEYTLPSGLPPVQKELLAVEESYLEALPKLITRLKEKSRFGDALETELRSVPLSNWKKAGGVVEIDDSNHPFFLPTRCVLAQAAVRQDGYVFYDGFIFDHMTERNRLGLVLHELTYALSGQADSAATRKAVGLALSSQEWDESSSLEIHQKLRPVGNFGFSAELGGGKIMVEVESEAAPLTLTLSTPIAMSWDEVAATVSKLEVESLESFIAGSFLKVYGKLAAPIETAEAWLKLQDGKPSRVTLDAAGAVRVGDHEVQGAKSITLLGTRLSLDDGRVSVETHLGKMWVTGPLAFENMVLRQGVISSTQTTAFGELCLSGAASFDEGGHLSFVGSVSRYDFVCRESRDDTGRTMAVTDATISINRSQLWLRPDGSLVKVAMSGGAGPIPMTVTAPLFGFWGVETVELDEANRVRRVTTGSLGKYRHKTATNDEVRTVGATTIALDASGNPE